jgi:hypothetical protein
VVLFWDFGLVQRVNGLDSGLLSEGEILVSLGVYVYAGLSNGNRNKVTNRLVWKSFWALWQILSKKLAENFILIS